MSPIPGSIRLSTQTVVYSATVLRKPGCTVVLEDMACREMTHALDPQKYCAVVDDNDGMYYSLVMDTTQITPED